MAIIALGYLGVRTDSLPDWSAFAGDLLGMQQIDRGGEQLAFRMDDRRQRLLIMDEPGNSLAFMGWEVTDTAALSRLSARISDAGVPVEAAPKSLADQRFVDEIVICHDPNGNRLEFFTGPMTTDDPFVPGRPISGFKTGPFGMGHAVLHTDNVAALLPFYRDLLGFRLSDYGEAPMPLYFFHVNGRHHSFALLGTGRTGFHHFMVEYTNIDDVGQSYDLSNLKEDAVAYTLGRHTNDWMTSYYAHTPSGFFVESGWGGRIIEPDTWEPEVLHDGPSLWGHDRPYLPAQQREAFMQIKLNAAAKGLQAPSPTDCPWLTGVLNTA